MSTYYERITECFEAVCDNCGEEFFTHAESFKEGLDELCAAGWRLYQAPGSTEWQHFCKTCK